jgi:hypothetical protein
VLAIRCGIVRGDQLGFSPEGLNHEGAHAARLYDERARWPARRSASQASGLADDRRSMESLGAVNVELTSGELHEMAEAAAKLEV